MDGAIFRSSDFAIPNLNSPLVEYEVLLRSISSKLQSGKTGAQSQEQASASSHRTSRSNSNSADPPNLGADTPEDASSSSNVPSSSQLTSEGHTSGSSSIVPYWPAKQQNNIELYRDDLLPRRRRAPNGSGRKRKAASALEEVNWDMSRAVRPRADNPWPLDRVSSGALDPFSTLPAKEPRFEIRVNQLLHMYLDGSILTDMRHSKATIIQRSVIETRKENSFVQIMRSRAAFNALIAYIETAPDPQVQLHNQTSVRWHIGQALSITNSQLADPQLHDSDSILVTILLLMLIAQRMNDETTFHAHAQGLTVLTARRRIDRKLTPYPTSSSTNTSNSNEARWNTAFPPNAFTGPFPEPRIPSVNSAHKQSAFLEMVNKGLVSPAFAKAQHYCIIINQLAAYARFDWIMALMASQHIWTDGGEPKWPALEMVCQGTLRLCMHINVWPVTSKPCLIALNRASAMRHYLLQINLDLLFYQCPNLLVWISLVSGPLAIGYARRWWAYVLRRAQSLSNLRTFREAVQLFEEQYAWTPAGSLAAEVFWVATVYPPTFQREAHADRDRKFWPLAKRLRMEAKAEPLMYMPCPRVRQNLDQLIVEAEDSLMATVAENAVSQVDARGEENWTVWIPPSPPCVLVRLCPAHAVP